MTAFGGLVTESSPAPHHLGRARLSLEFSLGGTEPLANFGACAEEQQMVAGARPAISMAKYCLAAMVINSFMGHSGVAGGGGLMVG